MLCNYNAADKIVHLPAGIAASSYILELIFTDGQRERRQIVVE